MASNISVIQIILLTVLATLCALDAYMFAGFQLSKPIIAGFLAGIIMGDMKTGLVVGATLQLMVLGIGTFGGASIPDFASRAIIGTALGVVSGKGIEFAIGVSVPVGLLLVQLDILARFIAIYFTHRADRHVERGEYNKMSMDAWLTLIPYGLSRALPVGLSLAFGNSVVKLVLDYAPDWLMGGLKLAGAVLPVVGIAILLHYLPIKKFAPYLIAGYFLAAYLKIPMMGIAIVGVIAAMIYYNNISNKVAQPAGIGSADVSDDEDEDEIEDDEEE
ncbi:PTS mannose/fructose/sorbose/N-acetylgalactosamine transporter subunit IIC [Companilactobacillus crustorum]|uniref:PTS mannose/fructose/sorbose/N-acetylgalactosamine transporter subunit IIC n=1 Tax=Companilactobacillus crustorum TaxID=392416 RepID=UPI00096AC941|nr:PTS sugar transporter subunit IIC [Companilactobacillus crustorum]